MRHSKAISQTIRICRTINARFIRNGRVEEQWLIDCTRLWNCIDQMDSQHCDYLWDLMQLELTEFFCLGLRDTPEATNTCYFTYYQDETMNVC